MASLPKGVFDILPYVDDKNKWKTIDFWNYVENSVRKISELYGFREIRTPVFEKQEVFLKVGEYSDIVQKETYNFLDKKGRSLTLRPEGTAAVVRSFIENRYYEKNIDHKFFYILPMFRYERQQSGRYRQHHQFGVEAIGIRSPLRDAEIISLLSDFYKDVGISNVVFHINSLGSDVSRANYEEALKFFFKKKVNDLSSLSQHRLETNVLRILDSKEPEDQEIVKLAPKIQDFLDKPSLDYFEQVLYILNTLNIKYEINSRLVRGLDYYTDVVFEAVVPNKKGPQHSIGGGGRYDGLIAKSGCPKNVPAFGFGVGLERVIQMLVQDQKDLGQTKPIMRFLPMGEEAEKYSFLWAKELRDNMVPAEVDWSVKDHGIKVALRNASSSGVAYVSVVGDEELETKQFSLKNMVIRKEFYGTKEQITERLVYEIQNTSL